MAASINYLVCVREMTYCHVVVDCKNKHGDTWHTTNWYKRDYGGGRFTKQVSRMPSITFIYEARDGGASGEARGGGAQRTLE